MGADQGKKPKEPKINSFAIMGFLLSGTAPPIGLVLSFISLSQIKKRGETGRILAIIGATISIFWTIALLGLAFWFFFIFTGNDPLAASDIEAKSDINTIHTQLEIHYKENGGYPEQVNATSLPELAPASLLAPNGDEYDYSPTDCESGLCQKFTLSATLENSNTYVKKSLDQPL